MFHPRGYRSLTLALLAAYVAASTFSGLFHDHHHGTGCCATHSVATADHAAVDRDHEAADCCHEHHDLAAGLNPFDDAAPWPADDDCSVCRFIGQRTLNVAIAAPLTVGEFGGELTVLEPTRPFVSLTRTTHSRAPPSLA